MNTDDDNSAATAALFNTLFYHKAAESAKNADGWTNSCVGVIFLAMEDVIRRARSRLLP